MIGEPEASWETDDGDDRAADGGWTVEGPYLPGPRPARRDPYATTGPSTMAGSRTGSDPYAPVGRAHAGGAAPAAEVLQGVEPGPGWFARLPAWGRGAVVGALAASVLWAALAYAGLAPRRHTAPDLHGYRIGSSPCSGSTFDAFGRAVDQAGGGPTDATFEHVAAVDRADCSYLAQSEPDPGTEFSYEVEAEVTLHHRTDPTAEFASELPVDARTMDLATATTPVKGLGDEAYLLSYDNLTRILKVRRGGAVIILRLEETTRVYGTRPDSERPSPPDLAKLTPSLVSAARAIMTAMAP